MNISGRTVIVTGGASGLGLAFVSHLRGLGAQVWALDCDADRIADAKRAFSAAPELAFLQCDVSDECAVTAAVRHIADNTGRVDVLVNNAAVLRDHSLVSKLGGKIRKHSLADWTSTLQSNLTGTFLMAREVAANMIERKSGGVIINVSSISRKGNPGQTAYAASKAGVDALTRTWADELAIYGIRVVAIAPGFVETNMTKQIPPLFLEQIRNKTPLKRFGTLGEFALTLQFVIENDYLNGTILEVNGGLKF